MVGYGLAKFAFRGRDFIFGMILAGVLVPGIVLAIPQYLLLAKIGLAGSYWSVLLFIQRYWRADLLAGGLKG